jgi:hypothetical protein
MKDGMNGGMMDVEYMPAYSFSIHMHTNDMEHRNIIKGEKRV